MSLFVTLTDSRGTVLTDPGNGQPVAPFNGIKIPGRNGASTNYPAGALFEINSLQNGLGSSYTIGSGGPVVGKTSFSEIVFTSMMGPLSITMFLNEIKGTLFSFVDVWVAKAVGDVVAPFQLFGTAESAITGVSWSSGGDLPTQSASVNFGKLWIGNRPDTNVSTRWSFHGWDRTTNKQIV